MGGSLGVGNVTSVAEFNVYTDPHAAQILLTSGLSIKMIGLNVTLQALLSKENINKLGGINQTGKMLQALFMHYADDQDGAKPMHDVNTLFYLAQPEAFVFEDYAIDVITQGPANGATVATKDHNTNVSVATSVNVEAFNKWFMTKITAI
jgi:non-specific riboncleoside hydrolase